MTKGPIKAQRASGAILAQGPRRAQKAQGPYLAKNATSPPRTAGVPQVPKDFPTQPLHAAADTSTTPDEMEEL